MAHPANPGKDTSVVYLPAHVTIEGTVYLRPQACVRQCPHEGEALSFITAPCAWTVYEEKPGGTFRETETIWDDTIQMLCRCCQHVVRDLDDVVALIQKRKRVYPEGDDPGPTCKRLTQRRAASRVFDLRLVPPKLRPVAAEDREAYEALKRLPDDSGFPEYDRRSGKSLTPAEKAAVKEGR